MPLTLAHSNPIAQLPQRMGGCAGWVWIGDVDVLAIVRSSAGAGDDLGAGEDGLGHDSTPLPCPALRFPALFFPSLGLSALLVAYFEVEDGGLGFVCYGICSWLGSRDGGRGRFYVRVEQTHGLNSGVAGDPCPDLPESRKWNG